MNELQRQAYLSALGIENYMPRWSLPCAPMPVACVLPVLELEDVESSRSLIAINDATRAPSPVARVQQSHQIDSPTITVDVLATLDIRQKPAQPVNATSILQQLEEQKPTIIAPFSLSVWRPLPGFLIIDSRNSALALPTDLLLNNVLRTFMPAEKLNLAEEVLRWPMIENRFVSRTEADARNELQTWLAVENELRPIDRVWLLGENAAKYLLSPDASVSDSYWKTVPITGLSGTGLSGNGKLTAFLLPSLNELLQRPLDKSRLWVLFN